MIIGQCVNKSVKGHYIRGTVVVLRAIDGQPTIQDLVKLAKRIKKG